MDLYDLEFNEMAAIVAVGVGVLIGIFFFADPLNTGMNESVPFFGRLIGLLGGTVLGYFIANRMID